jgi:hypothetical protein
MICGMLGSEVPSTGKGIQQFEIEAIRGKKVDHSESYGMEGRRKRTEKVFGWELEAFD